MLKKEQKIAALMRPMRESMEHFNNGAAVPFAHCILKMTETGRYPSQRAAAFRSLALYDMNTREDIPASLQKFDLSLREHETQEALFEAGIGAHHMLGRGWSREGQTPDDVLKIFEDEKYYREIGIRYFSKLMAHPGKPDLSARDALYTRNQAHKYLALLYLHPVDITREALEQDIDALPQLDDESFRLGMFFAEECEREDFQDKALTFVCARALMSRGETFQADAYYAKMMAIGKDIDTAMVALAAQYEGYKVLMRRHYGQARAYDFARGAVKAGDKLLDFMIHQKDFQIGAELDTELADLSMHFDIERDFNPAHINWPQYDQ
jgi:hypothetical protein